MEKFWRMGGDERERERGVDNGEKKLNKQGKYFPMLGW